MNLENLRDHYPKLIAYMETNSYSKSYVGKFKREIKKILSDKNIQKNGLAIRMYIWSML